MNESNETIKRVAKEGLEARNLVNWIADGSSEGIKTTGKPPTSPRAHLPPKSPIVDVAKDVESRLLLKTKRRGTLSRPKSRLRSASAGRNPEKDLRARYWTFLFENLHRAVDEIYQTCEMDESIVESKEAIMMLENYSKDFHALIQYINISKNYEKTAPINRPTSLAWEVRKSSPGKSLLKNVFIEKLTTGNNQAKKILCFDSSSDSQNISTEGLPLRLDSKQSINVKEEIVEKVNTVECQNILLDVPNSGITVSVVQETNEIFPCNKGLIVSEICCISDKVSTDKPSTIVETEFENVNIDTEPVIALSNSDENKVAPLILSSDSSKISMETDEFPNIKDDTDERSNIPTIKGINKSLLSHSNEIQDLAVIISGGGKELETATSEHLSKDKNTLPKCNKATEMEFKDDQHILSASSELVSRNNATSSKYSINNEDFLNKSVSVQVTSLNDDEKKDNLKKKILVKKSSRINGEKKNSSHTTCKQTTSSEDGSNVKMTDMLNKVTGRDKITLKSCKENEANDMIKETESNALTKHVNTVSITKKVAPKPAGEKPVSAKLISIPRKSSPKVDNSVDEKKSVKSYSKISAIQRNISYVSTLSSKNQLQKAASEEKKAPNRPVRTISHAMKLPHKSGSMSSLHKITATRRWSDKASSVEQIPEIIKSNVDEDSDGWETVRSRNRCRNSPAKKIPFSSEKNDKTLDIVKLNQSRYGGFPYTTKYNSKVGESKIMQKKDVKISHKEKQSKSDNSSPRPISSDISSSQNKSFSKKIANSTIKNSDKINAENSMDNLELKHSSSEKAFLKISKNNKLDLELLAALKLPENVSQRINNNLFKLNTLTKSASVPCLCEYGKNNFLKTKSLSELSLIVKKHNKMKYSRNSIEKFVNSVRKKNRKSSKSQNSAIEENSLSTSLDESDPGLTSDDQDGQTSHDEAYDAQCQELYDTAWKYKILEQQVHKLELSWGEQMDRFDMELRTPGRALEMHEKLSSPFRKKSLMESIRLQEEKQAKAREQRERLLEEKLQKIKEIEKKRQEMRTLSEQRQEKQRTLMEQKLQRAEEKRKKQLQMIIRKAHDEEEKVNEIAFINSLEAQNKRHDLISKEKDHEARLHDIQEERQRKQEEKAAKEAAAEERRKLLEAERQARLNEMQEKRKMRDHKVEQLFLVKEKERQELANQKARDREQRLSALNAQQQISIEELQKKIQLKQEESARRHEENMEQIRQKAFELSVRRCSSNNDDAPQPLPYETKKICTMCNVLIGSEVYLLSHLRGKKHQEIVKDQYQGKDPSVEELELYNLKHIVDASTDQLDPNIAFDKERQKALKKRCKKLRQRMSNKGQEYETQLEKSIDTVNSNVKAKMTKIIADIKKLITTHEKTSNDNSLLSALDRCLKEIDNVLEKKLYQDKVSFRVIGGLCAVIDIFKLVSSLPMEKSAFMHKRIMNNLSNTAESIVEKCLENCLYILFSNKIGCLMDMLIQRLNVLIPNNYNQMIVNTSKSSELNIQVDVTAGKLMHFLSKILLTLSAKSNELLQNNIENASQKGNHASEFQFRVQDVISYTVSIGIVDKLSQYFNSIQGPIGNEEEVANYLLECIVFLTSIIKLYSECFASSVNFKTDDSTQLIAAIKVTNMIGTVSLLYGLLLHSGVSSRGETSPLQLPKQIESLTLSTLCMLNHMAVMNLQAFQTILGSEGLSLQLRHITSHLLWYCNHWTSDILLHEVILLIGYFTALNVDNQFLIQAGQRPTVLQQLCSLPFLYFSDCQLTDILFPTLIACCYKNPSNKTILEQEMSSELLSNYIEVKYLNGEDYSQKSIKNLGKRWLFSTRFPKNCWSSAKQYFSAK